MLEFEGIRVCYGNQEAVGGLDLSLREGELLTLLGPSGCGKSTLIKVAAGFLQPTSGVVRMAGQDVTAMPPEARPTATVFQSHALFPHLSVQENVGYGLRARKIDATERLRAATKMLKRVGLSGYGPRPVQALSGGQQQRVALARALILNPSVLLLDEPLSSLDASLRVQMRQEIRGLQQAFGLTTLYVTHDQEEALSISDRVAVLREGKLVQLASPEVLYADPADAFVASFVSNANVLQDSAGDCFVRPDQLRLEVDPAGEGMIAEWQFRGAQTTWVVATVVVSASVLTADMVTCVQLPVPRGIVRVEGPSVFSADPLIPGVRVRVLWER